MSLSLSINRRSGERRGLHALSLASVVGLAASSATAQQTSITYTFGGYVEPDTSAAFPGFQTPPLLQNGAVLEFTSPPGAGTLVEADAYEVDLELVFSGNTGAFEPLVSLVFFEPYPFADVLPLFGDFISDAANRLTGATFRNAGGEFPSPTFTREFNLSGQETVTINFSFEFGGQVNEDGSFTLRFDNVDLTDTASGFPVGGLGLFQNLGDAGVTGQSNVAWPSTPFYDLNFLLFGLNPGDPGYNPGLNFGGRIIPSSRVTVTAIDAPEPTGSGAVTEWRFDGSLGAAFGPAVADYLDDPKFFMDVGPTPDSDGNPFLQTQDDSRATGAAAEVGVTERLSAFGTTSSFGIEPIDGVDATVWRSAPTDRPAGESDNARGIGLNVYPATAQFYGDDVDDTDRVLREFTLIYDIWIPQATWDRQFPLGLFNQDDDNDFSGFNPPNVLDGSDLIIARDISGFGIFGPGVLIGTAPSNVNGKLEDPMTPDFAPETWMRIAFVNDDNFELASKIYINGVPVVDLAYSQDIENRVDPLNPEWFQFDGSFATEPPIDPAVWAAWGNAANPWIDTADGFQLRSTFCLFCEPGGRAGDVFVANAYFAERLLSDEEIAALGGPSAAGIVSAGEVDGLPGLNFLDVVEHLAFLDAGLAPAEKDGVPGLTGDDTAVVLNAVAVGF